MDDEEAINEVVNLISLGGQLKDKDPAARRLGFNKAEEIYAVTEENCVETLEAREERSKEFRAAKAQSKDQNIEEIIRLIESVGIDDEEAQNDVVTLATQGGQPKDEEQAARSLGFYKENQPTLSKSKDSDTGGVKAIPSAEKAFPEPQRNVTLSGGSPKEMYQPLTRSLSSIFETENQPPPSTCKSKDSETGEVTAIPSAERAIPETKTVNDDSLKEVPLPLTPSLICISETENQPPPSTHKTQDSESGGVIVVSSQPKAFPVPRWKFTLNGNFSISENQLRNSGGAFASVPTKAKASSVPCLRKMDLVTAKNIAASLGCAVPPRITEIEEAHLPFWGSNDTKVDCSNGHVSDSTNGLKQADPNSTTVSFNASSGGQSSKVDKWDTAVVGDAGVESETTGKDGDSVEADTSPVDEKKPTATLKNDITPPVDMIEILDDSDEDVEMISASSKSRQEDAAASIFLRCASSTKTGTIPNGNNKSGNDMPVADKAQSCSSHLNRLFPIPAGGTPLPSPFHFQLAEPIIRGEFQLNAVVNVACQGELTTGWCKGRSGSGKKYRVEFPNGDCHYYTNLRVVENANEVRFVPPTNNF
ncbi:hypothetical protein IV203_020117 [Nitzschia inconspicua]|uniref:Uncharacterized protein n=1 Tax=Nitzschia inconspicua TaxID=303405 RepID=A0A9K3Q4Y0_9STRA|nr:hypothetical protein IV203_020117 [Nitzschia inconspicua]